MDISLYLLQEYLRHRVPVLIQRRLCYHLKMLMAELIVRFEYCSDALYQFPTERELLHTVALHFLKEVEVEIIVLLPYLNPLLLGVVSILFYLFQLSLSDHFVVFSSNLAR